MTKNTFSNFYYNKTYDLYHYSQICCNNTKEYRFSGMVVMDSLYNMGSKYSYLNREDVKIINYNKEDNILTVSICLDGDKKIESFKYDDDREYISQKLKSGTILMMMKKMNISVLNARTSATMLSAERFMMKL